MSEHFKLFRSRLLFVWSFKLQYSITVLFILGSVFGHTKTCFVCFQLGQLGTCFDSRSHHLEVYGSQHQLNGVFLKKEAQDSSYFWEQFSKNESQTNTHIHGMQWEWLVWQWEWLVWQCVITDAWPTICSAWLCMLTHWLFPYTNTLTARNPVCVSKPYAAVDALNWVIKALRP